MAQIATVAINSMIRVCEVLHDFNNDGFDSLVRKYSGGRPPKFTLPERERSRRSRSGLWCRRHQARQFEMAVRNGGRGTAEVTTLHAYVHNRRRRVFSRTSQRRLR